MYGENGMESTGVDASIPEEMLEARPTGYVRLWLWCSVPVSVSVVFSPAVGCCLELSFGLGFLFVS